MLLIYLSIVKFGYICLQTEIQVHGQNGTVWAHVPKARPYECGGHCGDMNVFLIVLSCTCAEISI